MQEHIINLNYKSGGLPELDFGELIAQVETIKFEKNYSLEGNQQVSQSSIKLHARVTLPEKLKDAKLSINLLPSTGTSAVCISDRNERGIGLLSGCSSEQKIESLELVAIFQSVFFEELERFLMQLHLQGHHSIHSKSSILGIGRGCAWEARDGPLLVKAIDFSASSN